MVRKARISDARAIGGLIDHYARRGLLLPKPLGRIYEALRTFLVWEHDGRVLGCGRLDIVWEDLAEVRSVAVHGGLRGRGIGTVLVEALVEEARELGIPRLFALTYEVKFFNRLGFSVISKQALPHKIWKVCLACEKYERCVEVAVMRVLDESAALTTQRAVTAADFGVPCFTRMPTPAPTRWIDGPSARPSSRHEGQAAAFDHASDAVPQPARSLRLKVVS
jgi:amino-acid N-acetyltransferase